MQTYFITYKTSSGYVHTIELKAYSQKQALFFFRKQVTVYANIISIYTNN